MTRLAAALLLICAGSVAQAFDVSLPAGSRLIAERDTALDSYRLPTGPWDLGSVPAVEIEGRVDRQVWRVDSAAITTLQLLDPLRKQVEDAGYEILFECADSVCGGFDFRFEIEVIPAPNMYVDIRDYRFLAARDGARAVSLLVSRSRTAGYVQIISVAPTSDAPLQVRDAAAPAQPDVAPVAVPVAEGFDQQLMETGRVALLNLEFATGTATLGDRTYPVLSELADFLRARPGARVALVGHTDAVGALGDNIALSRRRAQSVLDRLVSEYEVNPAQLAAEGMGYLAPIASNLTRDGRELNRRVEVILLSLE